MDFKMIARENTNSTNEHPPADDRLLLKWLEAQPIPIQTQLARDQLDDLLCKATQPHHVSGNACTKLCRFIEQCKTSKFANIREVAFSGKTLLDLFNFYIEWNEKNQHRSMRQVLELLASLFSLQPVEEISLSVKESLLRRLVSIITHQDAQSLVKPAFKSLEYFLGKRIISTDSLISCFQDLRVFSDVSTNDRVAEPVIFRDLLIGDVFEWLALPDTSAAAGKLLVTLFIALGSLSRESPNQAPGQTVLWQQWIRDGLNKYPETLENVKNYLFVPLFKLDRFGSLSFLGNLNNQESISDLKSDDLEAHYLLLLAATDVGKKSGLVEEPSTMKLQKDPKKSTKCVVLEEDIIGSFLTHASDTVRSLAFSVLVSSSSSIRPFSLRALALLRSHMGFLYADTDAKFRNEVLSNTKHMIDRIRGATAYLVREAENLRFLLGQKDAANRITYQKDQEIFENIGQHLERHKSFIEWYLEFLCGELIPTASYQRHVTSLKAITLFLRSGIALGSNTKSEPKISSDNATVWPYHLDFFTNRVLRLLLDLLMDPFEDVRSNASTVLKLAYPGNFSYGKLELRDKGLKLKPLRSTIVEVELQDTSLAPLPTSSSNDSKEKSRDLSLELLLDFIPRAQLLSKRTGRADYADGVARSYELLYSLMPSIDARLDLFEELVNELDLKVYTAEKNLAQAVLDAPVHGNLAALNLVWDSMDHFLDTKSSNSAEEVHAHWNSLQYRMFHSCSRIWEAVKDILCNDSPEGHLPQDLDGTEIIDTKDVLSYSFRAIHESSNLMRTIVSKTNSNWSNGSAILPNEIFIGIGDLTFEQLSTLRHRGAFSTVSLTFTKCCQLTQHHAPSDKSSYELLYKWYQGTLKCIFEQSSTTRRSAGIPALMTGILSANSKHPSFEYVMTELKSLALKPIKISETDETSLSQVHAMNSLKEIFKSSTLGRRAESHIAECLAIATSSLNSEIWAIRNCGLLLLRSLIDALFGTSESKAITEAGWDGRSIRLSYDKYTALPELLLNLLNNNANKIEPFITPTINSVESVFPALDIIRRGGPPNTHRDEIYQQVSIHLESKVWDVREIAARTLCTLMLHENWLSALVDLVQTSKASSNRLHGVLMVVRFVLERRLALSPGSAFNGLSLLINLFNDPKHQNIRENRCPQIIAAYLEVCNIISKIYLLSTHEILPEKPVSQHGDPLIELLFSHDPYEELKDLTMKCLSLTVSFRGTENGRNAALAFNSVLRRAILTCAVRGDTLTLERVISHASMLGEDIALAAMEFAPDAWRSHKTTDILFGLCKVYIHAIEASQSSDVRSATIFNLADVLDRYFSHFEHSSSKHSLESSTATRESNLHLNEIFYREIGNLGCLLARGKEIPSLSSAGIRISGSILACEYIRQKNLAMPIKRFGERIEAWGGLLLYAGNADCDFETRHAAAAALASFYTNPLVKVYGNPDDYGLTSIFALYDTLNDDDDEIRDLGAKTVSALLKKSMVPLAAQEGLAEYICISHSEEPSLPQNVICRITGCQPETYDAEFLLPALGPQLFRATQIDNSLFVEEEQNLFIDEVREVKLWCRIFEDRMLEDVEDHRSNPKVCKSWSEARVAFEQWILEGLLSVNTLLAEEDGPLGWTSKPTVFALMTRLFIAANTIIRIHETPLTSPKVESVQSSQVVEDIVILFAQVVDLSGIKKVHGSLLLEAYKDSPLV